MTKLTKQDFSSVLKALENGHSARLSGWPFDMNISLKKGSYDQHLLRPVDSRLETVLRPIAVEGVPASLFNFTGDRDTSTVFPSITLVYGRKVQPGWLPSAEQLFSRSWEIISHEATTGCDSTSPLMHSHVNSNAGCNESAGLNAYKAKPVND